VYSRLSALCRRPDLPPLVLSRSLSLRQALAEKYSCPAALLATPAVSYIIDKAAASEASELIEASLAEAEAEALLGSESRADRG
jgi:hypothetical protein